MKQDSYQGENEELKQLHFLRISRLGQNQQFASEAIDLTKQMKLEGEEKEKKERKGNEIYLNSLIYDKRSKEQKFHSVALPNFLHENVENCPMRPISNQVEAVMMTNYGFEMSVFLPIAKSGVPFFVFNRSTDSKQGHVEREYEGFQNMTVISPPKHTPGYGVFHTKLWLIKFKKFLRVVVSTSNNHLYDWAVWQNAYWYHDCPLLKASKQGIKIGFQKEQQGQKDKQKDKKQQKSFDYEGDFAETLKQVISEMQPYGFNVLKEMNISLAMYSFKNVKAILIPSLAGRFKGKHMDKVGLGKIRKVLKDFSIKMQNPTLTVNCTSLGRLDEKFVRDVYSAFCPSSGLMDMNRFRLVFPTEAYIKKQTCGAAEVLFLTPENYAKCGLAKQIFYRYQPSEFNGAAGNIPHLKTMIIQEEKSSKLILYMGSHNLTKAAWGTFEKNESQINCNNEELGLLFLDYSEEELLQWLPYRYPPTKYQADDRPFLRE